MLFFGHTGLTVGAAFLLEKALNRSALTANNRNSNPGETTFSRWHPRHWLAASTKVDYRIVAAGSLLPDIIDKPLGLIFFRSSLGNSRIFFHTLLVTLLLVILGLVVRKKYNSLVLLTLAFGSLTHLVFDRMWRNTETLFWPLFGFGFPHRDETDWLVKMLRKGLTDPGVYLPEIAGALVLILLGLRTISRKALRDSVKHGRLP